MVKDTDARAVLKGERVDYWLGVGAKPSDNVKVLIKKYGSSGTHLEQQKQALEKLRPKRRPTVQHTAMADEQADDSAHEDAADSAELEQPAQAE